MMLSLLSEIHAMQQRNVEMLRSVINSSPAEVASTLVAGPFKTCGELRAFDTTLVGDRKAAFAKELQSLQGSNVGSTTRKIMAYLMTDEVASLFSWLGRKGKAKFCELNMASAIVHVVKKCHSLGANLEVEETMKAWLRHAPGRCRNPALLVPAAVPALQQAKNI
ncbi:uncharacterized protein ISCGN_024944 [Ixodes scapularis]